MFKVCKTVLDRWREPLIRERWCGLKRIKSARLIWICTEIIIVKHLTVMNRCTFIELKQRKSKILYLRFLRSLSFDWEDISNTRECFITFQNTSKFVNNTPLRVVFNSLLRVWKHDESLPLVSDILLEKNVFCIYRLLQKARLKRNNAVVIRDSLRNEMSKRSKTEEENREKREQLASISFVHQYFFRL